MIQSKFTAQTYGPFIFVRPKAKDDIGMLEHEKIHVKQFWESWGTFGLWYWLSKKSRAKYEAEAYREQLKYHPDKTEVYAWNLATKYNLGITQDQARAMLAV
jgi:hypothetical protein